MQQELASVSPDSPDGDDEGVSSSLNCLINRLTFSGFVDNVNLWCEDELFGKQTGKGLWALIIITTGINISDKGLDDLLSWTV